MSLAKVKLVGGGPGDPGLLTLKGREAIAQAECLVYDRLISPELLNWAPADCERIYVGKKASQHTMRQEDINQLLVDKAREGKRVVRLKGGDVYVFGRGGEEGLALRENGIPFEVIPGISSCIAGLAYAGIPITHRGLSHGFQVVTAHDRRDALADLDFAALAANPDTLVFMMGLGKLDEITERLLKHGKCADTPCAVIAEATLPQQDRVIGTLATISGQVREHPLPSPALIVVGQVVTLAEKLDFYNQKPDRLRILVTKVNPEPSPLAESLRKRGFVCEEVMTGEIAELRTVLSLDQLKQVSWIGFTSRNGIRSFFHSLWDSGLDVRALAGCQIAVVGSGCEEVLKRFGLRADFVPTAYDGQAMGEQWQALLKPSDQVLLVQGKEGSEVLHRQLRSVCTLDILTVYHNREVPLPKLNPEDFDIAAYTCASSARRLIQADNRWAACRALSIGPKTTETLKQLGVCRILEAEQSRYEAMAEALETQADYAAG